MRLATLSLCLSVMAQSVWADVDRLIDAMGIPPLIDAFVTEGRDAGQSINEAFLNGQGGAVWAETVQRIYDPQRMESELRSVMAEELDAATAEQALLFFESELGARIITLEVQARQAFMDEQVEAAAKAAPSTSGEAVTAYLSARGLIDRNADVAVAAQAAFLDGLAEASGQAGDVPDMDGLRARILVDTESWLRGYNALVQSALSADDIAIYTSFWETEVGNAVDDALFLAFGQSYTTLSFALGQAAGRLVPQNEL
ncbi:DUF2059 domain-containing protein [Tateyamaria sp. ANG-S1]|uniref:DUF2059 domain-containing protein n=1 Tax=Tateyamaria sp. ANG-S1 TaxID=1577905 RepID=UPI0005830ACB|nr:DUF2059 domain-containing protein [Tateyamaria sp. ANG-S1]KIC48792.1 hypothetical protein RA29_14000 [Tateyamaria sp. ANG-S1]